MSALVNVGHELRLFLCSTLLLIVLWVVPPRNREGQVIVRGLGRITSQWKELLEAR